jgi:hypothetical protein
MMRKIIGLAVLGFVSVSPWLIYSKVTQARRETAYRVAIAPFQRDLPVGLAKGDVEMYLDSRKIDYHVVKVGGSEGETYEIKIGEEPGSLVCERWEVYIALEFSSHDTLREVHITKSGVCL